MDIHTYSEPPVSKLGIFTHILNMVSEFSVQFSFFLGACLKKNQFGVGVFGTKSGAEIGTSFEPAL